MARVVVFSNRASTWGLAQDAALVEQVLRECHATRSAHIQSIDHMDPVTFINPKPVDIQIHLEVPCRLAWPWAKINMVVVNPEGWPNKAWDWALAAADTVVFKCSAAAAAFPEVPAARRLILPWRPPVTHAALITATAKENKVLYLVGGSVHKAAAAKEVVAAWKPEWPPLEVWCAPALLDELQAAALGGGESGERRIVWNTAYKTDTEKLAAQKAARFHCVASAAEGFGYTMAECAAVGSLPLWTGLNVFEELWEPVLGFVGKVITTNISSSTSSSFGATRQAPVTFTRANLEVAMESLLALTPAQEAELQHKLKQCATNLVTEWRATWKTWLKGVERRLRRIEQPLVLRRFPKFELPKVAIVTVTRNRPRWFANMSRNVLGQDYPTDKLVWVIVDDGDGTGRVDQEVLKFQQKTPCIAVEYVSLTKPLTVGEKRNRGCAVGAERGAEVFVMMDDDDHYPRASTEARVTYLRLLGTAGVGCVYCGRIQMYDCLRYISAMNVSPMDLSPAERVSEATLAFTRAFWETRAFPATSVAEGEAFLAGRDAETAEIPPESVIVSFLHGKNSTSRRVPQASEANGCHYGFDDAFFLYLCNVAGAPDHP